MDFTLYGTHFLDLIELVDYGVEQPIVYDANQHWCVNCDTPLPQNRNVYCTEVCNQEATLIRYVRRTRQDGRTIRPDIREAIGTRLHFVLNGGYPQKARRIPSLLRDAVFTRDQNTCQICGAVGTEIDHRQGNEATLANLQVLCKRCNLHKVELSAVPIQDATRQQQMQEKVNLLARRVASLLPVRICDDELTWKTVWRHVQQIHRSERVECEICGAPVSTREANEHGTGETLIDDDGVAYAVESYLCEDCSDIGDDGSVYHTAQGTPIEEF